MASGTILSSDTGCRGSSGTSMLELPGMMYSGGVQSTDSGLLTFLSENTKVEIRQTEDEDETDANLAEHCFYL